MDCAGQAADGGALTPPASPAANEDLPCCRTRRVRVPVQRNIGTPSSPSPSNESRTNRERRYLLNRHNGLDSPAGASGSIGASRPGCALGRPDTAPTMPPTRPRESPAPYSTRTGTGASNLSFRADIEPASPPTVTPKEHEPGYAAGLLAALQCCWQVWSLASRVARAGALRSHREIYVK